MATALDAHLDATASALARLKGNADALGAGMASAIDRLADVPARLLALGRAGPTFTPPSAPGSMGRLPSGPLPVLPPPASRLPVSALASSLPLEFAKPSALALAPTPAGPTSGDLGAKLPLPLPVRVVAMDSRVQAVLAASALPSQIATVAAQRGAASGGKMSSMADWMQGAGSRAVGAFGQVKDTLMSLASVGDPFLAWPTYQASVEGLSITIGQMFSPALLEVSKYIQSVTAYLDGLDEATKSYYAKIVLASAGTLAGVAVLYKLGQAFYAVSVAARAAGIAMMTTPVGMILGIAGAVAAVAAAWYLAGNNANNAATAASKVAGIVAGLRGAASAEIQPGDLEQVSPETRQQIQWASQTKSPTNLNKAREALAKEAESVQAAYEKADKLFQATVPTRDAAIQFDAAVRKTFADTVRQSTTTISLFNQYPDLLQGKVPEGVKLTPFQQSIFRERPQTMDQVHRLVGNEADARFSSSLVNQATALPDAFRDRVIAELRSEIPSTFFTQGYRSAPLGTLAKTRPELVDPERIPYVTPAADVMIDRKLRLEYLRAKDKLDAVLRLQATVGGSAPAGPLLATSGLPAPVISSTEALADRMQVAALKGDDLQSANLQKQLQALEQNNVLLREIKDAIRDSRALPSWMY
jgi:hypothetical protein